MNNVDDDNLRIYIVWLPTLRSDNKVEAVLRTQEFNDDRLTHFWDEEMLAGKSWQEVLDIRGVAWDVYFLYGRDATWVDSPQFPDFYMHQLGRLKPEYRLSLEPMEQKTREFLK